jgi:pimeloyl-ACP methyl ester carboxylesterase
LEGVVKVPTLVLHGLSDGCIDSQLFRIALGEQGRGDEQGGGHALFPMGLKLEFVGGAGHWVHQERPDVVNELAIDWIKTRGAHRVIGAQAEGKPVST